MQPRRYGFFIIITFYHDSGARGGCREAVGGARAMGMKSCSDLGSRREERGGGRRSTRRVVVSDIVPDWF